MVQAKDTSKSRAGGGWTPSILPEVEGKLQTTAGSVATVKLPEDRKDLWDKASFK